ncbi:ImcF-related family protein [Pantoea sp. GD03673]|uniref:ImcF-related family protein n=1 Tax=Pantoea sp. GD03673 TaxID=2975364 RepID=UPI00244C9FDC|nr:ImcF-related family protein [Pantoea sp. GD03673]MDH2067441.1 type VI secretion protein VasK [Pantoea sp. GD03673]
MNKRLFRIPGSMMMLLVVGLIAGLAIWFFGPEWHLTRQQQGLYWLAMMAVTALLQVAWRQYRQRMPESTGNPHVKKDTPAEPTFINEIRTYLSHHYGRRWKRKVRFVVITGTPHQAGQIIPGLVEAQWLEANGVVAVWGGNLTSGAESVRITALRKLRRCPVSAIVLAYDAALRQAMPTDTVARQLTERCKKLGWQVPLYLWEVQNYVWPQQERETQPVGVLLPAQASPAELAAALQTLPAQLTEPGIRQGMNNSHFAFLLQLSAMLRDGAAEQFQRLSTPLLTGPYAVPLRGVMFSPPVAAKDADKHRWLPDNSWQRILDDLPGLKIRRAGFAWERVVYQTVMAVLLLLWGGLLLSWWTNHRAMSEAQQLVQAAADVSLPEDKRLISFGQLQRKVDQLDWRRQHGTPWNSRLGLSQNDALLNALWPHYARIALPELRDGAVQHLSMALERWSTLPVNDPQRAEQSKDAYGWLKAYLMLSHPQKMDAALFADTVMRVWPQRKDVSLGLWQAEGANQLRFMAQHLPDHKEWQIKPDMALVSASRTALLRTIGMRNGESAQYQKVLARVSHNYADLSLHDMTGDTDAGRLFVSDSVVSGMFTRQAWEGAVQPAIEKVVSDRREEIDWVLSDSEQPSGSENSPEMLKARLTERYFTDYAGAWQDFLNGIRWQQADTLSDAIDQLTLLADVRQSPLVALMNTLNQQGRTGQMREALSDSLVKSAKNLLNHAPQNNIDQKSGPHGPMDATFAPVLSLMDRSNDSGNSLSLQTFLTRVTRVRLKLQQVTGAADPQAMMQALAQTVFRGKSVDITDTRDYGSLVAASLGQEWSGFGQAVFVQPMVQAWQQVLAPTASSINSQWQTSIVQDWESDFNDRWPFSPQKQSEASLPLLSQYLRNDTGRVTQFVKENLGGVLRKEGRRWVPDAMAAQGLHFNPAFIDALNQLSALADVAFTGGDASVQFALMGKPGRDVIQTILQLDQLVLDYHNQQEQWQNISWPDSHWKPRTSLSWVTTTTGERIYASYPGSWGLIRLLDRAQVTAVDNSTYKLSWKTSDGFGLNYMLRTEVSNGPLALLGLKGFRLPQQVFANQIKESEDE